MNGETPSYETTKPLAGLQSIYFSGSSNDAENTGSMETYLWQVTSGYSFSKNDTVDFSIYVHGSSDGNKETYWNRANIMVQYSTAPTGP